MSLFILEAVFSKFVRMTEDIFQHGVLLTLAGVQVYLKLQARVWTSEDYSAVSSTWTSKTASGLLPCLWCSNVMLQSSDLAEGSDYLVPVSCPEFEKFDIRTEQDFHTIASMLASSERNKLADLEKACGFVHMPDTCIANSTCCFCYIG